jgi:hypothetical protein
MVDETFGNSGFAGKIFRADESIDLNAVRTNDVLNRMGKSIHHSEVMGT